ncbi:MAG: right-handed parallel beta-helix repeat-containing protein, partial [Planctomycetota bacterium]
DRNEGRDTDLENLTFQGGLAHTGGAIIMDGNISATFRNLVFRNNVGVVDGGAIFYNGGSGTANEEPLFVDCLFENNVSQSTQTNGWDGGAAFVTAGAPTFLRCTFRNNSGAQGGALAMGNCHRIDVIDCVFEDNDALFDGGGLRVESSQNVTVVGSTFTGNTGAAFGGGVYFENSTNVRFVGNDVVRNATRDGGGLDALDSDVFIDRSRFFGNTATSRGGGLRFNRSDATITNSVVVGNFTGDDGGGVTVFGESTAFLENCTVTANQAGDQIGGVFPDSMSRTTLLNTIVTGNTASVGTVIDWGGTGTVAAYTASYSIVDVSGLNGGTFGPNLLVAAPLDLFVRVPDAGADAIWGTTDDDYGDLRLLPTAIAIDSGSSTDYTGPLADLDANDRAQDDPNTPDTGLAFMEPTVDMGAFEFDIQTLGGNACSGDFDLDGDVDLGDFGVFGSDFGRSDCND